MSLVTGAELGAIVRERREARGWTVDDLCRVIGGTPGAAFLARLEEGLMGPSSSLVLKLAAALGMPADLMLNAAGFATEGQRAKAITALGGTLPRRPADDA